MKKILILPALLPFVSFGITSSDVVPNAAHVYTFDSLTSLNDYSASYTSVNLYSDDPFIAYSSTPFGLAFGSNHQISLPSQSSSSSTNSAFDINYPVRCTLVGSNSRVFVNPLLWDSCNRLFYLCVNLYLSGYRGPGAVSVNTKSTPLAVNFNFPVLVSDILSSTNTTFRQILLSNLSSIHSSLVSIDSGVSALAPVLADIRHINSSISSNTASIVDSSSQISTNTALVATSVSGINDRVNDLYDAAGSIGTSLSNVLGNTSALVDFSSSMNTNIASIASSSSQMATNTASILRSSAQMATNTASIAQSSSQMATNTASIAQSSSQMATNTASIASSSSQMATNTASILRSSAQMETNTASIAQSSSQMATNTASIVNTVSSLDDKASQSLDQLSTIDNHLLNNGTTLYELVRTAYKIKDSNNSLLGSLIGDPSNLPPDNPYFPYDPDNPNDPNHPSNPNSPLNPNSPNSLMGGGGFGSFTTNQVLRPITNVVDDASQAIQSNATSNADSIRENDDRNWQNFMDQATGDGAGLNVRITYPLRYESSHEVNVHDAEVADAIRNGYVNINELKSAILEALNNSDPSVRISGTNSVDWLPWFSKWDPYSETVTNYYADYNSSVPVADLASRFLSDGFDFDEYNGLPWFSRVEVLLAMIADTSTNSVDVADIESQLDDLVDDFKDLGTNVVISSSSFVGLFDYFKRTADRFKLVFGDRSAPVTGSGITLLAAGHWIGQEPLVLKIDTTVQNVLRLFFRCFWLLFALVALWLVLSWSWQKVIAVLRWLWSMFDL